MSEHEFAREMLYIRYDIILTPHDTFKFIELQLTGTCQRIPTAPRKGGVAPMVLHPPT